MVRLLQKNLSLIPDRMFSQHLEVARIGCRNSDQLRIFHILCPDPKIRLAQTVGPLFTTNDEISKGHGLLLIVLNQASQTIPLIQICPSWIIILIKSFRAEQSLKQTASKTELKSILRKMLLTHDSCGRASSKVMGSSPQLRNILANNY